MYEYEPFQEENNNLIDNELENVKDELVVKEILDALKAKSGQTKDKETADELNLEDFFENNNNNTYNNFNKNQKDKNDIVVEAKLSELNKTTQTHIELSQLGLDKFNANLLKGFRLIQYLYLQDNDIGSLQYDFFKILNRLKYLDLRNNRLICLPCSICYHECLEILLLQNNCIQRVPKEIGSLPKLRGIQISHNPISYPAESIISQGSQAIIDHLRQEWVQYESSSSFQMHRNNGVVPASAVQISAKNDSATNDRAGSKRHKYRTRPKQTSSRDGDKTSPLTSGAEQGDSKLENINYKSDPGCMVVNKIETGKKNLPHGTEEAKDTWSTSQISSTSQSQSSKNPHSTTQSKTSKSASSLNHSQSSTSITRRRRKLQHYSQILNPYRPHQMSAPLDASQTQAMYLRKLIQLNMKFIAAHRNKLLQKMKDAEMLSKWRDDYRTLCETDKHSDFGQKGDGEGLKLPYAVYEEFQKMMSREDLVRNGAGKKTTKRPPRRVVDVEKEGRQLEAKMVEIQKTLDNFDSMMKTYGSNEPNMKGDTGAENVEDSIGQGKQKYLLEQIYKMQELQNEIKSLSQLNDTLM
ncbi:hypothetical protein M8J76_001971 [Diaphorina citri]|nr:hypothetical protein M8J75_010843 [Diaphorina citri]KAI5713601.1 hypothetical protein M8J76_001971 [Diaphorina citri]